VREGGALLQGLASCGHRLRTHYSGRNSAPGYHCSGENLVEGRGSYCCVQIDEAVTRAFIAALEPAKLAATVAAAERLEAHREATLKQWRLGVERASYEATRAERRCRAVAGCPWRRGRVGGEPQRARSRAGRTDAARSGTPARALRGGAQKLDLRSGQISAPCGMRRRLHRATARSCSGHCSKKSLSKSSATSFHLTMRWKGGSLTELDLYLPHSKPQIVRTDEDTIGLVRRLAAGGFGC
jgi:hypothetical protein